MDLTIQKNQKEHLSELVGESPESLEKHLNFFGKSSHDKFDNAIGALIKLLIDAKKAKVSEKMFRSFLKQETEFTDGQIDVFWKLLNNNSSLFHRSNELRFRDLQWRLDAKVATRSLDNQAEPKIKMKLILDSESSLENRDKLSGTANSENQVTKKEVLMETDLLNLSHIIVQMEEALMESKSHRTRNFLKASQQ
ncbi:unnamed protein product [Diamesa serratosioi]